MNEFNYVRTGLLMVLIGIIGLGTAVFTPLEAGFTGPTGSTLALPQFVVDASLWSVRLAESPDTRVEPVYRMARSSGDANKPVSNNQSSAPETENPGKRFAGVSFGPVDAVEEKVEELDEKANEYWQDVWNLDCDNSDTQAKDCPSANIPNRVWKFWRNNPGNQPANFGATPVKASHEAGTDTTSGADPVNETRTANWSVNTDRPISAVVAVRGDGTIFTTNHDGDLYSISPGGAVNWTYSAAAKVQSSPMIDSDSNVYFGSHDGSVHAVDPAGNQKWTHGMGNWVTASPAMGPDSTVYVGAINGTFKAINPDGSEQWAIQIGDTITASAVVTADSMIYVGGWNNNLYALDASGAIDWTYSTGGDIKSSVAVGSDGTIYVGSEEGNLHAVNPNGTRKWTASTGDAIRASPVIGADSTVYVGSWDHKLYAFDSAGNQKWTFRTGNRITAAGAVGDTGAVYVGSGDGNVYAVDTSGNGLWKVNTGEAVSSSMTVRNGVGYIGSGDGNLYALTLDSTGYAASAWPSAQKNNQNDGSGVAGQGVSPSIQITSPNNNHDTNVSPITVAGTVNNGNAGDSVQVFVNGTVQDTLVIGGAGGWSTPSATLSTTVNTVDAVVYDTAPTSLTHDTATITVNYDTVAPAPDTTTLFVSDGQDTAFYADLGGDSILRDGNDITFSIGVSGADSVDLYYNRTGLPASTTDTQVLMTNVAGTTWKTTVAASQFALADSVNFIVHAKDNATNTGVTDRAGSGHEFEVGAPPHSGPTWYVNDNDTSSDVYTARAGSDSYSGSSQYPFLSISKAMNQVSAGDTVQVDAGTFGETVAIDTNSLALVGADSSATILDFNDSTTITSGILVQGRTGVEIRNLRVVNSFEGIDFDNTDNSRIEGVVTAYNGNRGIVVRNGSNLNTLTDNESFNNTSRGFQLRSDTNTLTNSLSRGNSAPGIYLDSAGNTVTNNVSRNNNDHGVVLGSIAAESNTFENNVSRNNASRGFDVTWGGNNTFNSNTSENNGTEGFYFVNSSNNVLTNNTIRNNGASGFRVDGVTESKLIQNAIHSNTGWAISIENGASTGTFTKNNITTSATNPDSGLNNTSGNFHTINRNYWDTTDQSLIVQQVGDPVNDPVPYRLGSVDTGVGADTVAPVSPISDTAVGQDQQATVRWDQVTQDEDGSALDFHRYRVYRTTYDTESDWKANASLIHTSTAGDATDTGYVDTGLVNGQTYYYRITAVDNHTLENESFFSDTMTAIPTPGPASFDTTSIQAGDGSGTLTVSQLDGSGTLDDTASHVVSVSASADSVNLYYRVDGASASTTDTQIALNQVAADSFRGSIPEASFSAGDTVNFILEGLNSIGDTTVEDRSGQGYAYGVTGHNGPTWYVNDGSTVNDIFTTSTGSDTSGNGSSAAPFRTIPKASTKADTGDTVRIDAGTYSETVFVTVDNLSMIGADSSTAGTVLDPGDSTAGPLNAGINVNDNSGVLVKDLRIRNAWEGVKLVDAPLSEIRNVTVEQNGHYGLFLNDGTGIGADTTTIVNVVAQNNDDYGFEVINSDSLTLKKSLAKNNTGHGIYLSGSSDGYLANNVSDNNDSHGINLVSGASNNTLTNNTSTSNGLRGFNLDTSNGNTLSNNSSSGNVNYGYFLTSANNNTLTNNSSTSNGYTGIELQQSSFNTLTGNTSSNNSSDGIVLQSSADTNTLKNNISKNNPAGFYFLSVSNIKVIGNTSRDNTGYGIRASSGSDFTIKHNRSFNNDGNGIVLWSVPNSTVVENTSDSNTGWQIALQERSENDTVTKNNILPPSSLPDSGFSNSATRNHDITRNYFGSTDESVLNNRISDTANSFIPYRLGKVDTSPTGDSIAPASPVSDTSVAGNQQVEVRWDQVTLDEDGSALDFTGGEYRVYRTTFDTESDWKQNASLIHTSVAGDATDTGYVDTGLVNGQTYYYRITAVDNHTPENESFFSDTVSATPSVPPLAFDTTSIQAYNITGTDTLTTSVGELSGGFTIDVADTHFFKVAAQNADSVSIFYTRDGTPATTSDSSFEAIVADSDATYDTWQTSLWSFGSFNEFDVGDTINFIFQAQKTSGETLVTDNAGAGYQYSVTQASPFVDTSTLKVTDSFDTITGGSQFDGTQQLSLAVDTHTLSVDVTSADTVTGYVTSVGIATTADTPITFSPVSSSTWQAKAGDATVKDVSDGDYVSFIIQAEQTDGDTQLVNRGGLGFEYNLVADHYDSSALFVSNGSDTLTASQLLGGNFLLADTHTISIPVKNADTVIVFNTDDGSNAETDTDPQALTRFSSGSEYDTWQIKPDQRDDIGETAAFIFQTTEATPGNNSDTERLDPGGIGYNYRVVGLPSIDTGSLFATDQSDTLRNSAGELDGSFSLVFSDTNYVVVQTTNADSVWSFANLQGDTPTTSDTKVIWDLDSTGSNADTWVDPISPQALSGGTTVSFIVVAQNPAGDTTVIDRGGPGYRYQLVNKPSFDTSTLRVGDGVDTLTQSQLNGSNNLGDTFDHTTRIQVPGADTVNLYYRQDGTTASTADTQVPLTNTAGDTYEGILPDTDIVGGDTVNFILEGINSAGDTIIEDSGGVGFEYWVFKYEGPTWYVNDNSTANDVFTSSLGNDSSGIGSANDPYRTISKAMTKVTAGDTVKADAGTYGDTVTIPVNNLALVGADSSATGTVIDYGDSTSGTGAVGLLASAQSELTVKDLRITNTYRGIHFDNVDTSTIRNVTSLLNGRYGIHLNSGSDGNLVKNSVMNDNSSMGLKVEIADQNTIRRNQALNNTFDGINLGGGSTNNLLDTNTVSSNSGSGFQLTSSSVSNVLKGNRVENNGSDGITVDGGANRNQFINNIVRSNANDGIALSSADTNTLKRNLLKNNTNGIYLFNTTANNISLNRLTANTSYQVYVTGVTSDQPVKKNNILVSGGSDSFVFNDVAGETFDLTRNWWGTTDESTISGKIGGTSSDSIVSTPYRLGKIDTGVGADTVAPESPVSDTPVAGDQQIEVRWDQITLDEDGSALDFTGGEYRVYRTTFDTESDWKQNASLIHTSVAGDATDTGYVDTGLVNGDTYYYRVTAVDNATPENESFFSDTATAAPTPVAPSIDTTTISAGDGVDTLTYTQLNGNNNLGDTYGHTVQVQATNADTVNLYYRRDGSMASSVVDTKVTFTNTGGDTFEGTIPDTVVTGGDTVNFILEGINSVGDTVIEDSGGVGYEYWVQKYDGPTWYVNDNSTTNDVFTSSTGTDSSGIGSSNDPFRTISKAMTKVSTGDTVKADAGTYGETVTINTDSLALVGADSSVSVVNFGDSTSTTGAGIRVAGLSNVSIKDLMVTNAYKGIEFDSVTNSTLERLTAVQNGQDGFALINNSNTNTVANIESNNNSNNGFTIDGGAGNTVQSSSIVGNANRGIRLANNTQDNDILNNHLDNNADRGINVASNGGDVIKGNSVQNSGRPGIDVGFSQDVLIEDNTVKSGNDHGILLYNADNDTVIGNKVTSNDSDGIFLDNGSVRNRVEGNTVTLNGFSALSAKNSSDTNVFVGNIAKSSSANAGMWIENSNDNLVKNNALNSSADYGVRFQFTTKRNVVRQNDIENNTDEQVSVTGSPSDNVVRKNNIRPSAANPDSGVQYNGTDTMVFQRNYWNTTDRTQIKADIGGTNADSVIFSPYRLGKVDTGVGADTIAPADPVADTAIAQISNQIEVRWAQIPNSDGDFQEYRVYRTTFDTEPDWKSNATIVHTSTSSAADTGYIDTGLVAGDTYYYRVTAVDNSTPENESFFSDTMTATAKFWDTGVVNLSQKWESGADVSMPNSDTVYFIGGTRAGASTTVVRAYTDTTGWTSSQPGNVPGSGLTDLSATATSDTLFVLGGTDGGSDTSAVKAYDFTQDKWFRYTNMPFTTSQGKAVIVGDTIYKIGGGINESSDNDTVASYDIKQGPSGSWDTPTNFPGGYRYSHEAVAANGGFYVIGGNGFSGATSDVQFYDPSTKTWTSKSSMPTGRDSLSAVQKGGKIYAIGGYSGTSAHDQVEIYDISSDSWTSGTSLPTARSDVMGGLSGEKIIIGGGVYDFNTVPTVNRAKP